MRKLLNPVVLTACVWLGAAAGGLPDQKSELSGAIRKLPRLGTTAN